MKWARIKNKTKRRGGYHRPTNEITHPANDIHCTNKTRNYKLKNELHCICPLFLHVQLIFLFKLNVVSPIGSTLDQEKTVDIYGTPVWHISFNFCNDKDSHSAKESGKEGEHGRTWNKIEFYDERKIIFIFVRIIFVCVHDSRWITDLKHENTLNNWNFSGNSAGHHKDYIHVL